MAIRYIKSVLWLVGCSTLGYGLLLTLTSNEQQLKKKLPTLEPPQVSANKNQQFLKVLQSAADSNKPLYRLDKEGIEREIKKN